MSRHSALRTQNSALKRELRQLRQQLRETQRSINCGALDPVVGATLMTRLTNAINRLVATQHRITLPEDEGADLRREFDRIRRTLAEIEAESEGE